MAINAFRVSLFNSHLHAVIQNWNIIKFVQVIIQFPGTFKIVHSIGSIQSGK